MSTTDWARKTQKSKQILVAVKPTQLHVFILKDDDFVVKTSHILTRDPATTAIYTEIYIKDTYSDGYFPSMC